MKNIFRKLFVMMMAMMIIAPAYVTTATAAPQQMTAAQKAKAKEAEKKKKEREKAAAQKQKEREKAAAQKQKEREKAAKEAEKKKAAADKQRAAAQKENEKKRAEAQKQSEERKEQAAKAQAERQKEVEKAQAERQKEMEKRQQAQEKKAAERAEQEAKQAEKEQKMKKAYYDQLNAAPRTETVSLFNIYGRAGYAAMFDKVNNADGSKLDDRKLIGGPGAGLGAAYELEHGKFRFSTGLDFTWLNSATKYGYMFNRPIAGATDREQIYMVSGAKETRNLGYVGVPVMLGAEFDKFFFMVGVKAGYKIIDSYSTSGTYDIIEYNKTVHNFTPVAADQEFSGLKGKTDIYPFDLSACIELGLDLDEWLQQQPDKKKKVKVKPGERLPFGREHIHYKVSVFADYSVLGNKNASGLLPMTFADNVNTVQAPTGSNSMVGINGGSGLSNLFVGAKFTVQFEVPGKKARPLPAPTSYADIRVVDNATGALLEGVRVEIKNTDADRVTMRERELPKGAHKQRVKMGNYSIHADINDYYPVTMAFSVDSVGVTRPVEIRMNHVPVLKVKVLNRETKAAIPATIAIRKRGTEHVIQTMATDSAKGEGRAMLSDSIYYSLHIEQMGYERYDADLANIGDNLVIELEPIKKGEVFVVHNLFFATNKTRILKTSEQALTDLQMYLLRNPEVRIRIMGHTDSVGKDAANQKLSEGRAKAVRDELIERGVAAERLESVGYGETKPIDTNETEEGRQNNRRVEIEIL